MKSPTGIEEVVALESVIRAALPVARATARRVGSQHALWDSIADAEAILAGKPTLLQGTRLARLQAIALGLA